MFLSLLTGPWHWAFSGFAVALVMLALTYFGNFFGLSSTYRVFCAIGGAGKRTPFFNFNWKSQMWNLFFAGGVVLGAGLTHYFVPNEGSIISVDTQEYLFRLGLIDRVASAQHFPLLPPMLFDVESPVFGRALPLLIAGGFISGFGARYAGGCTSGHIISGLSNLQIPSLIMTICFVLGGILFTNVGLPLLAGLF